MKSKLATNRSTKKPLTRHSKATSQDMESLPFGVIIGIVIAVVVVLAMLLWVFRNELKSYVLVPVGTIPIKHQYMR